MVSQGYALSRAELLRALVARTFITTADGAGTNDTLIASELIGLDSRKIVEKTILIDSGLSAGEDAAATVFDPVTGTITVDPAFSNQIMAGTIVRLVNLSSVELDVINILTGQKAQGDKVYYDSTSAFAGTDYPVGCRQQPVNNLPDLRTILTNRNLNIVAALSNLTLDADMAGVVFMSENPSYMGGITFDPNGFDVTDCIFYQLALTGAPLAGANFNAVECWCDSLTAPTGTNFFRCNITNGLSHEAGAAVGYFNCIFGGATIDVNSGEFNISGGTINESLAIENHDAVLTSFADVDGGELILDATCTAGSLDLWGNCSLTDNSVGLTVNDHRLASTSATGRLQEAPATIDLNQAAGDYDLFTGTTQVVILESLVIAMPNAAAGGALTSISIQTDDATPQVIRASATIPVADMTAENQFYWTGKIRIGVGKKIQLTINGGATGAGYVCNVNAEYRSVDDGGILA